ncbi:PH domain-containing protein [Sphaerisporangium corydalis]|uniref:PH domain-containing protein n=1 Tax=Sphaerisporangium corydalis TaxID=1441875 RepID=A0ABV9E5V9_9ACTN|nr:PH domain-containing protein [Sphaerisporangium corydalis]
MTGLSQWTRQWRVRRDFTIAKLATAAAFAVVAVVVSGDTRGMLLCAAAAVMLGAFGLRDVLAPVRLAADDQGLLVVTGVTRRARVSWPEVAEIRVADNARYGLRWDLLEIETAESLHIFSSFELGTSCMDAADELFRLRPG